MPQSMLAMLAIVITGMLFMQQHQARLHAQQETIRKEISTQMLAVAVDRLEEIGFMAFDEATVGSNTVITSASMLTPRDSFIWDAQGNDIDDFDGVSLDTFRVSAGQNIWFNIETTVTYADEAQPDLAVVGPTKVKKATIKVYTVADSLHGVTMPDTFFLSQSYACGSWCGW